MSIPVIINNRDLLTWPKAMVEKIKTYDGVGEIIIIDNGSTYPPLLEWYETNPCKVIKLSNLGYSAPWVSGVVSSLESEYYVVTDSDMGLDDTPSDTLLYLKDKLKELNLLKLGLGLDWKKVTEESPYYNHMQNYEKPRWDNSPVISGVHTEIMVDTTFALYSVKHYFIGGSSVGFPYIARHYPWEFSKKSREENEEFSFYIKNATTASSYKAFLGL